MEVSKPDVAGLIKIEGTIEYYEVPKYQREYDWRKLDWEQLIQDISENEKGYFLGTIICVEKKRKQGDDVIYEIIDGQQRLVTISLLLILIYKRFKDLLNDNYDDDLKDEIKSKMNNIKNRLVQLKYIKTNGIAKKELRLRVKPSSQGFNDIEFLNLIKSIIIESGEHETIKKNSKLLSAYDYFENNQDEIDTFSELSDFLDKVYSLQFICIKVDESAKAYILFETLNNRGKDLTALDIIKNKLLSELESREISDIDESFEKWKQFLAYFNDYKDKERFLRQFYNAFMIKEDIKVEKIPRATKPQLINIYDKLIDRDPEKLFNHFLEKASIYSKFLAPEEFPDNSISEALIDLKRIGAAPSYTLLLYLFSLDKTNYENDEFLHNILNLLIKYYVRRNITDVPNTNSLDTINLKIIKECENNLKNDRKLTFDLIENIILNETKWKPSDLSTFESKVSANIYDINPEMTRYLLSSLNSQFNSKEYNPDLWKRSENGKLVWTIEHIFPKGENIPDCWINMAAEGSREKAKELHKNYVHCFGNLTLSGYNPNLSNLDFHTKQDKNEEVKSYGHTVNIGYKNGLALNNQIKFWFNDEETSLSEVKIWNENTIKARNEAIVKMILKTYKFRNE